MSARERCQSSAVYLPHALQDAYRRTKFALRTYLFLNEITVYVLLASLNPLRTYNFVIDAIDHTVAIAIPSLSLLTTETNEVSEAEKSQPHKASPCLGEGRKG